MITVLYVLLLWVAIGIVVAFVVGKMIAYGMGEDDDEK